MRNPNVRVPLSIASCVLVAFGCGARTVNLDRASTDAGYSNPNSSPDAIAPDVSVVIEDQETAIRVAVDESRIYWLSTMPNGWSGTLPPVYARVRSCLKSDCRSTVTTYETIVWDLSSPQDPGLPYMFSELVVASGNVYWYKTRGSQSELLTCPSAGCAGAPRIVARPIDLTSLAADDTHVYWTSRGDTAVLRLPLSGSGAPQAIALNEGNSGGIVVNATHVYWIGNIGGAQSTIKRVAKDGGEAPTVLATEQNQASVLALDDRFVYWANVYSIGTISRCPLSGCVDAPAVIAVDQSRTRALTTDGQSIFWINSVDIGAPLRSAGTVLRCAADDCAASTQTLAAQTFADSGMSLALDAHHLYWVAQGDYAPGMEGFYPHATIYRHAR